MYRKGLICVFTGNGAGKSSAAFGLALRASGQGLKVLILQFMKLNNNIGELKALEESTLPIRLEQHGHRGFFKTRTCETKDILLASRGMEAFRMALESDRYDMIILDEINVAVYFGLVDWGELRWLIEEKPPRLHLVLTGRNAQPELVEMADLVTEMQELKHPYQKGVPAQAGIEF